MNSKLYLNNMIWNDKLKRNKLLENDKIIYACAKLRKHWI